MESEQTFIYKFENLGNSEKALQNVVADLRNKLQNKFGGAYVVSSGSIAAPDKDWSHEITVRQGNKIGACVNLKWEKSSPSTLKIYVDESSKMGNAILYGIIIPSILVGAYMGYNHIEPLAFLPGKKIAAGLGGLITLIPGLLIAFGIKSVMLKNEKQANAQLVKDVEQTIRN